VATRLVVACVILQMNCYKTETIVMLPSLYAQGRDFGL